MKALGVLLATGVVVAALMLGRLGLLALGTGVGIAATGELLRLARSPSIRPAAIPALAGTVSMMLVAYAREGGSPRWFPLVIASVFAFSVGDVLLRRERTQVTRSLAYTIMPVLLVGLFGAYLLALRALEDGFRLVLILVLMVAAGAVVVAVVHAQNERARPTWQRFAASIAGALAVGILAALVFDETFGWGAAFFLAIVVGLVGPLGELVTEMIEQDLLRLEPGTTRAGASLLRRIDGLLLSAPVFFYAFRLLAR